MWWQQQRVVGLYYITHRLFGCLANEKKKNAWSYVCVCVWDDSDFVLRNSRMKTKISLFMRLDKRDYCTMQREGAHIDTDSAVDDTENYHQAHIKSQRCRRSDKLAACLSPIYWMENLFFKAKHNARAK